MCLTYADFTEWYTDDHYQSFTREDKIMDLKTCLVQMSVDSPYIKENDEQNGEPTSWLDGKKMFTKDEALTEVYNQLGLTKYLDNKNYDGLEELMQPDLWPDQAKLSLGIRNSQEFIDQGDPEVVKTLFDIFRSTGDAWSADNSRVFSVLLT